ncbi:recombinase family protein [Sutcliffiella cohnii]|uniref:recombinase family protein n=1 Tax=Sutcliffiella cohnii TaxID=33932 RepID=UPI002E20149F|nr:recombinase family protein [Sutcliffiella cohnii]MED4016314.1 recombinase family protein [Sutcliffiella cohnii]
MSHYQSTKNRAAIYVRVSTMKEEQKLSPEHQLGICIEKARAEGYEVRDEWIYEDRDTGTSITTRQSIKRLVEDAKLNLFDLVIFASLSRFSRDTLDSLKLKRELVDNSKIRLISLDEGYDSFIDRDELKFQILSAVNQKLSEQISLSSRRGIRQSALKGNYIASRAPYGYKKIIDKKGIKTLAPDEETKGFVKLIFELYTSHQMGEKSIVDHLNSIPVKSPKGGKWGVTTIQRILQNEAYIGKNVFGKYRVEQKFINDLDISERKKVLVQKAKELWETSPRMHEAIIEESVFLKAQELRLERGGGKRGGVRNKVNVFAGVIKCKHCNSSMVSMKCKNGKNISDGREYRYLVCSQRRRQGEFGCKNNKWIPYYQFRDELLEEISAKIQSITSVEQLFEKYKDVIKLKDNNSEKEIIKLEKELEENRKLLFELRKDKKLGEITEKQYLYEKQQFEKDIYNIEEKIQILQEDLKKKKDITELYEVTKEALEELLNLDFESFEELHHIVKKLIQEITIDIEGNIDVQTTFGININEL